MRIVAKYVSVIILIAILASGCIIACGGGGGGGGGGEGGGTTSGGLASGEVCHADSECSSGICVGEDTDPGPGGAGLCQ